jgi:hypothetical protein
MNVKVLSKVISSREQKKITNHLLEVYDYLSPRQRKEIKLLLSK